MSKPSESSSLLADLKAQEQGLIEQQRALATEQQGMLRNLGDMDEEGLQDEVATLNMQLHGMTDPIEHSVAQALKPLSEHLLAQHQLLFEDPQAAAVAQSMAHDEQKAKDLWVAAMGEGKGGQMASQWCIVLRDIAARQRTLLELLKLAPTRKVDALQQALRGVTEALAANRAQQVKLAKN